MKVLVIGSGGREHAIIWKLKQSSIIEKIFCVPGNAGISLISECVDIKISDFKAIASFVKQNNIEYTIVGPEVPLAEGITDYFEKENLKIFGPNKKAAQLEGSKVFAKNFMKKYNISTALYNTFTDYSKAAAFLNKWDWSRQLVVKADGLAAGKGVIICQDAGSAHAAIKSIMEDKVFGAAGKEVVLEEFLDGEEASIQIFLDGKHYSIMTSVQDHKRLKDGDIGPNTGGMGTYAPAPIFTSTIQQKVEKNIIEPLIHGLRNEKIEYKGILYLGLMISAGEPYVLEFNCRFGDPETQVVMPLLKTDLIEIVQKVIESKLNEIKIEWQNKSAVCVVLASKGYPGEYYKGIEITGLEDASKIKDVVVFHAGTELKNSSILTSGGRVLGVTGMGRDLREAMSSAYKAIEKISFNGMQYRRDIGYKALAKIVK